MICPACNVGDAKKFFCKGCTDKLTEYHLSEPVPDATFSAWQEFESMCRITRVFIAGFSKDERSISMMSYSAVIRYEALEALVKMVRRRYSMEQWRGMIRYVHGFSYLSPIASLTAIWISRILGDTMYAWYEKNCHGKEPRIRV